MRLTTVNPMPWIAAGFAYHWFGWHGFFLVVLLSAEVKFKFNY